MEPWLETSKVVTQLFQNFEFLNDLLLGCKSSEPAGAGTNYTIICRKCERCQRGYATERGLKGHIKRPGSCGSYYKRRKKADKKALVNQRNKEILEKIKESVDQASQEQNGEFVKIKV